MTIEEDRRFAVGLDQVIGGAQTMVGSAQEKVRKSGVLDELNWRLEGQLALLRDRIERLDVVGDRLFGQAPQGVGQADEGVNGDGTLVSLSHSLEGFDHLLARLNSVVERLEKL